MDTQLRQLRTCTREVGSNCQEALHRLASHVYSDLRERDEVSAIIRGVAAEAVVRVSGLLWLLFIDIKKKKTLSLYSHSGGKSRRRGTGPTPVSRRFPSRVPSFFTN